MIGREKSGGWDHIPTAVGYLYLIVDVFSRKIVGRAVLAEESANPAARLFQTTVW